MTAPFDALPEEIKLAIIDHLDSKPPSTRDIQSHLSASFTSCDDKPLKQLSLVSRSWNRLVRPLLCYHAVLRLAPSREIGHEVNDPAEEEYPEAINLAVHMASEKRFVKMLKDGIAGLSSVIKEGHPTRHMKSLVVITELDVCENDGPLSTSFESYYIATRHFWAALFMLVDPLKLVIAAPVGTLEAMIDRPVHWNDGWAFPEMSFQVLQLTQDTNATLLPNINPVGRFGLEALGRFQQRSEEGSDEGNVTSTTPDLLGLRPWAAMHLYEGSCLKAYESYEYFHKRAPSLVGLLIKKMKMVCEATDSWFDQVLFPFNTHLSEYDFFMLANHFRHLRFRFCPSADDRTLDDPERVGRVDRIDCWAETESLYRGMIPSLATRSRVQTFRSDDYHVFSIKEILDERFGVLDGWEQVGYGRWARTDPVES